MTKSVLEHVNITVTDAEKTAAWLGDVFGWDIRWQGASKNGGHSIHIGNDAQYIVAYQPPVAVSDNAANDTQRGWLNHIGVVVEDLDGTEARVRGAGFDAFNHGDYEPGRRFYFLDHDGVEWEVVSYG